MPNFDYSSILIILPERLGDALFHTPAIRLLKIERPDLHIGVVALSTLCAELLKNNPFIDAIHVTPSADDARRLSSAYDATLLLHDHKAARRCAQLIGLPTIIIEKGTRGSSHRSQNSYDFICKLLNVTDAKADHRYNLYPSAENHAHIQGLLRANGASEGDILIGCHIGCHSIAKRGWKFWRPLTHPKVWPLENFIALEAALREIDHRFRLVLTGSKSERGLGEKFTRATPTVINLIDQTSVLDLAALMQHITLFISSDTGALHVACATGVGLVALFGPTRLDVTGPHPMQPNYTILQRAQLTDITVPQVISAITEHPDIALRMKS